MGGEKGGIDKEAEDERGWKNRKRLEMREDGRRR